MTVVGPEAFHMIFSFIFHRILGRLTIELLLGKFDRQDRFARSVEALEPSFNSVMGSETSKLNFHEAMTDIVLPNRIYVFSRTRSITQRTLLLPIRPPRLKSVANLNCTLFMTSESLMEVPSHVCCSKNVWCHFFMKFIVPSGRAYFWFCVRRYTFLAFSLIWKNILIELETSSIPERIIVSCPA